MMGALKEFVTPLHQGTTRDYIQRMLDDKAYCMEVAKRYEEEYWDGDRRYGYGGYKYIPGRWKPVAESLITTYKLGPGSKVLDIGCGKGFLLAEMLLIEPQLQIVGMDISTHALKCADSSIKNFIINGDASEQLVFEDQSFDLVISLGVLYNLDLKSLFFSLNEIERVSKASYVMVESYRTNQELFNLQCWALTCKIFLDPQDWKFLFSKAGYKGDYEFIFFE
jgi:2-polyprenyl-3-methyl-5-hydroxy-6-metoxy-1,4-benzoquinol methylase